MRRLIFLCLLFFSMSGMVCAQQMTDEQVIQYVKEAQKTGKTQQQMSTELLRRGVTREQIQRIQANYSSATGNLQGFQTTDKQSRMRTRKEYENKTDRMKKMSEEEEEIKGIRKPVKKRYESDEMINNLSSSSSSFFPSLTPIDTTLNLFAPDMQQLMMEPKKEDPTQQIFGHNIFDNENLTFEPNINVATPQNYRLGPGDEVIIDVWGASQVTIREVISPEGSVLVDNLGPVYLNGKTVEEANAYLKEEFSKIYSGVGGDAPTTQIKLTLGEIRSIQVNVMGEVVAPGTYTLSSLASVFHALYRAGGINDIGSLRSIKVVRAGETVADLDVYDYIMQGKIENDIRLQDGDVIIVSPYQSLVQILGKVKRPMFYEMKPTETMDVLLNYAGNFTGDAYKKAVRVIRKAGRERQVYNVDEAEFSSFTVNDGDVVSVDSVLHRFENRLEVRGAVYREGLYQLNEEVNSVKKLVAKADGIRGDAFLNRAIISREHEDLTCEIIQIDLKGILNGTAADIPLQKNDILYIPSIHDLREEATVTIHGEVGVPGTYLYSEKMTVEDLVLQAGGLLESAATIKIEVARRVKNPTSTSFSTTVGEVFSFDLKNGLLVGNGSENFYLEPFDEVYIRRSPSYYEQQNVVVGGEVLFRGNYALSKKNERLSDLIAKAGGVTPDAYVKGARLVRKMTETERRRKEDAIRMTRMTAGGNDSISVEMLDVSDYYSVGINLERALESPGSDDDLVLRDGDMLYVPEYVGTVKVNGAVMYPNTVAYRKGEKLKYYINQAGGYGTNAKKRKVFIVYMNGTVSRAKSRSTHVVEPGCEIIVPSKNKNGMTVSELMSIGTTSASIATMIASMVNLFK